MLFKNINPAWAISAALTSVFFTTSALAEDFIHSVEVGKHYGEQGTKMNMECLKQGVKRFLVKDISELSNPIKVEAANNTHKISAYYHGEIGAYAHVTGIYMTKAIEEIVPNEPYIEAEPDGLGGKNTIPAHLRADFDNFLAEIKNCPARHQTGPAVS